MKNTLELQKQAAYLEFVQDQLVSEIQEVNDLLVGIGFPEGIRSLVTVANELIENGVSHEDEY